MGCNLLVFVLCFFKYRNNLDSSYIQPLAVNIYAYNNALRITFMRDVVRGQHARNEIVLFFDYLIRPLLQGADFTIFLCVNRG